LADEVSCAPGMFGRPGGFAGVFTVAFDELLLVADGGFAGTCGNELFPLENMLGPVQPIDIVNPANRKPVQALVVKVIIHELP
jgi:hypothetical protein